jgi:hypothetical protein
MQSTKSQAGIWVRVVVILLALLALIAAYYWAHKPFDIEELRALLQGLGSGGEATSTAAATALPENHLLTVIGGALLDLLTVTVLFGIAGGIGRKIIAMIGSRLHLDFMLLSRAERFALAGVFGLLIIALCALTLGMVGLFRNLFFWIPLVVVGVLLQRDVRGWVKDARALVAAIRPHTRWGWLLLIFSSFMLALALLHSLVPPYSWDGVVYHLVGPRDYLADGRISPQADNFYLGFPKSTEMLFSVAISLFGRDSAAALVHYGFGFLGLLALGGLARRYSETIETPLLAVVLLIGSFSLWLLMGWAYVDLAVLALSVLAFSLVNLWRESQESRWLIVLGLTCGFALGVKLTSGLLIAALGLYILVYQPKQVIRNALFFGIPMFVVFLPWMIRGVLHYGNPIYPYIFNGLNWDAGRTELFNQIGKGMLSLGQGWQLPLLPFTATVFGTENAEPYGFTISPWLLTLQFLLLLVWKWVPEPTRKLALGGALIQIPIFIFWAIAAANAGIAMQTRLMIVMLPISALLGALAVDALSRMPEKPIDLYFIIRTLIVLTLLLSVKDVLTWFNRARVGEYLLGDISREDFVFTHLVTNPVAMQRLGDLPDGSQVRFLWENRSYYCPPEITCIPDALFDQWSSSLAPDFLPQAVFQEWQERGDDYILFFNHGYQAYVNYIGHRPEENALVPEALEQYMVELWTTPDGRYTLYTWAENTG